MESEIQQRTKFKKSPAEEKTIRSIVWLLSLKTGTLVGMSENKTFAEYYQYYLTLHQNKWCRRLHVMGQLSTVSLLLFSIISKTWLLLFLVPFVVYPFAWFGHFYFEKNKPAAWSKPLWAKACDWVMLKDIVTGKVKW